MREILFRGKSEKTGNWIEGSLIVGRDLESGQLEYLIAPLSAYYTEVKKVIPETIGQYTGLTDKNGKRIFEGDIVKLYLIDGIAVGVIGYCDIDFRFKFYENNIFGYGFDNECVFEIIGNIHDNPELLGEE